MRTLAPRLWRFLGPIVLTAAIGVAADGLRAQQPTFHSGIRTVAVYATVHSHDGHLLTDLNKDDFQVFDNGKPVEITTFSNETLPITVALLLDMSGSMVRQYFRVQDASLHFVDVLLPADRVRVGTFSHETSLSPLLTGDKPTLRRVLHEELWPGGSGTPLWMASWLGMQSLATEQGRRVLLFLTDGIDSGDNCRPDTNNPLVQATGRCAEPWAVRNRATNEDFMFYAIGFEGDGLAQELVAMTDDTGGGHFIVAHDADLGATFEGVANELHHQYVLGFTPAVLDGKSHKLEVKMVRPDFHARARKTYIATAEGR